MIQKGLLEVGDPVVAGAAFGKVKALIDDQGKQIKSAGTSDAGPRSSASGSHLRR